MVRGAGMIGCLLVGGLMWAATSAAEEQFDCHLVLLKVPPGETRLEADQASAASGAFMATGHFSVVWGDSTFTSGGATLRWNGVELPLQPGAAPPGTSVKVLATPRIATPLGGRGAQVKAGMNEPTQYLEREADGRFVLRVSPIVPELNLTFTLEKASVAGALRVGWSYDLTQLGERKPLPGVSLPVGPPEIRKLSARSAAQVKVGEWCLMAFRETAGLAVFLKILPQR
jgi:hypothetical protein